MVLGRNLEVFRLQTTASKFKVETQQTTPFLSLKLKIGVFKVKRAGILYFDLKNIGDRKQSHAAGLMDTLDPPLFWVYNTFKTVWELL